MTRRRYAPGGLDVPVDTGVDSEKHVAHAQELSRLRSVRDTHPIRADARDRCEAPFFGEDLRVFADGQLRLSHDREALQ